MHAPPLNSSLPQELDPSRAPPTIVSVVTEQPPSLASDIRICKSLAALPDLSSLSEQPISRTKCSQDVDDAGCRRRGSFKLMIVRATVACGVC